MSIVQMGLLQKLKVLDNTLSGEDVLEGFTFELTTLL